jgi:hypothetical protein
MTGERLCARPQCVVRRSWVTRVMTQFPPPEPDESLGLAPDGSFAIGRAVAVHLPGAGDSAADERLVDTILRLRPGLLFVAGSAG